MVAVAVKVLLLAYCSYAVQKFDVRTKININGEPKSEKVEEEIADELRTLFCEEELQPAQLVGDCKVLVLDTDLTEKDSSEGTLKTYIGDATFKVSLEMEDGTSKIDLKKDFETKVENVINGNSGNDGSGDGSASGSGESSGSGDSATWQNTMIDVLEPFTDFESDTLIDETTSYNLIDTTSLKYDSFVVCVGECKDEGFWMMIAFVSTAGFCLLTGGLSCLGSRRIRQGSSAFNSLLLLGLIGGMIYVGVVEKVNWKITGGCVGMLVLVNLIGCCNSTKSETKVKNDEIEEYWDDLAKRDAEAKRE